MKHSREEVIKALQTIQTECNEYIRFCTDCPFYVNNKCKIVSNNPDEWQIRLLDKQWRAFI